MNISYYLQKDELTRDDLVFLLGRTEPEDLDQLLSALTKENVLRSIEEMGSFVLFFRAKLFGKMKPVNLKAVRIKHDRDHIILGLREKKELTDAEAQSGARG